MTTGVRTAGTDGDTAPTATVLGYLADYVRLTKPRIISLLLVTTAAAMFVAADGRPGGLALFWTMIGGYLAAGGANAINQFVDRDIDATMARTTDRPVVSGRVSPTHALIFGILLGAASALLLGFLVNWLAAALAVVGLLVYVGVYTIWLKRSTPHNIVIGGAAGAVPPLVGWAAATGSLSLEAWLLFAIVFFWTPPHFWALALILSKDYASVRVPMLPVVSGDKETRLQVLVWSFVMVGVSLLPVASGDAGGIYFGSALALGAVFVALAFGAWREADLRYTRHTFKYSLLYLALLFIALVVDAL